MDAFTVNQQIEELGYVDITDLSDDELAELFEAMVYQEAES